MNAVSFSKILGGAALTLAAVAPCFATNLLSNPSFETGDFTGWTVTGAAANGVATSGTPVAAYFADQVNVLSGNYAPMASSTGTAAPPPR